MTFNNVSLQYQSCLNCYSLVAQRSNQLYLQKTAMTFPCTLTALVPAFSIGKEDLESDYSQSLCNNYPASFHLFSPFALEPLLLLSHFAATSAPLHPDKMPHLFSSYPWNIFRHFLSVFWGLPSMMYNWCWKRCHRHWICFYLIDICCLTLFRDHPQFKLFKSYGIIFI